MAKSNPELAYRIYSGLLKLIKSGEFDQLFEQVLQKIPEQLNLPDRRTIYLQNPFQSAETRMNDRTFWQYKMKKPAFILQ